jgi:hypothetical protein
MTTANFHVHKWREIENHATNMPMLREWVCDCGWRKFVGANGKVFYTQGYFLP